MKKFGKAVAEYDMFGHTIALNFNKGGDSHKTAIGGFFSIFIKAAMFIYVFMNFRKMIFNLDDSNSVEYNLEDLENGPPIPMNGTDFTMFHVIRKQVSGKKLFYDDPEVRRHIDMYFVQIK